MSQFIPIEIYQSNNKSRNTVFINPHVITHILDYPHESCLELALDYNKLAGSTIPRKVIVCKDKNEEAYNMLLNTIRKS
jgi:hypothetical protein